MNVSLPGGIVVGFPDTACHISAVLSRRDYMADYFCPRPRFSKLG